MYTLSSILPHIRYNVSLLPDPELFFDTLSYDTRKIRVAGSSLFFALIQQRDGHQYIEDAYTMGVRNFVVSDKMVDTSKYVDANFVWVDNTLIALQEIATYHRNHFHYPIIGITGSNGKTIVKSWLHQLLSPDKKIYQSPKSYNSQLGVGLSLWNLSSTYELALIEAGISKTGEMDALQRMIQPNVGIFTSLGTAHKEGFSSKKEKLKEKWKLFKDVETIIAPSSIYSELEIKDARCLTWGEKADDDLQLIHRERYGQKTILKLQYADERFDITIPFVDRASLDNVMTCVLTMLYFGYDVETIGVRMLSLKPLEMRLKLKRGKYNSSIIDDTYSNDLASLQIALDFLGQQQQSEKKKLILSDFEGEEWTDRLIDKLVNLLNSQSLEEIILLGNRLIAIKDRLKPRTLLYDSTSDLLDDLHTIDFRNSIVLLKGGRKFELERVSKLLVEQSHDTVLEISLKSLEHNLSQYRSCLKKGVRMMAMVKAFSYGSGSFEVANVLQFNKLDYLTVAFADEGAELRRAGINLPIMVLSPHEGTFEDILYYRLEPEIYSLRILHAFIDFLKIKKIEAYPIHFKLDTGMHRLGFMSDEVPAALNVICSNSQVRIASVFSHLVGAGAKEFEAFSRQQIVAFKDNSAYIESKIGYTVLKHICNTSGIVYHPEAHMDMVRLGIGLYGFDMAPNKLRLEDVSILKTTITQIKRLTESETVGYDRKGVLHRDSNIATVKIGYADGYDRRFGNGVGKMLINGKFVPTIGNICMDMCMLDITDIDANEGDEVIVFPDLSQAARDIGTIPYELLTGISSRVKRVYFYE